MKSSVFAAIAAASVVAAHGGIVSITANGKNYPASRVGSPPGDSPVRSINSVEPVGIANAGSDAMTCGHGPQAGSGVAEVTAGSSIDFAMVNGEGGQWVHRNGPIIYSIYKCPGDAPSCTPGSDAGWAVIGHAGSDGADWLMAKFANGQSVSVTVPKDTPNGDYVIRQELVGLHNLNLGAELYIQCAQIRVTGGTNGTLAEHGAQLTSYPGAYNGGEPGFKYNAFGGGYTDYPFPGPALWTGGGSSGSTNTPPPPPPTQNTPPPPPPPTQNTPPTSGGSCSPGQIQCDSPSTWSMCANGMWVSMGAVAPGTTCQNGAMTRRSSRLFRI